MCNRKQTIEDMLKCDDLKSLDKDAFLKGWQAIAFIYPSPPPGRGG
jgi:hypothetical protein